MLTQPFSGGDYNKLVQVVLLYLSDNKGLNFKRFQQREALHKARWMSKMLHTLKMVLLDEKIVRELPIGTVFASNQR